MRHSLSLRAGSSHSSDVGAHDGMRARHWASQGARGAVWQPRLCRARAPFVRVVGRVDGVQRPVLARL